MANMPITFKKYQVLSPKTDPSSGPFLGPPVDLSRKLPGGLPDSFRDPSRTSHRQPPGPFPDASRTISRTPGPFSDSQPVSELLVASRASRGRAGPRPQGAAPRAQTALRDRCQTDAEGEATSEAARRANSHPVDKSLLFPFLVTDLLLSHRSMAS